MKEFNSESFLGSGYKRFDLKYIFDSLRNVGLTAMLFIAGLKIIDHSGAEILSKYMIEPKYIGFIMVLLSVLLLTVNFIQFLYVATYKGTRLAVSFSALISFPVYIVTIYLFYFYVFIK